MATRLPMILLLCAMCAAPATAQTVPDDLDGARAAAQAAQASVNETSARTVVPGYTATPPETGYAGADLAAAARARLAACAGSSDPSCQGQRAGYTAADTPRVPLGDSAAQVAAAKDVARAPAGTLGSLSDYYSGCAAGGTCTSGVFCFGERCFNTASVNDPDFAQTISYIEAARQAGTYLDPATLRVFKGEVGACTSTPISNCCFTEPGGKRMNNGSMFGTGTKVVFDILMNADNRTFIMNGLKAMLTTAGFDGTFSTFGFTMAVNGTALPAGSVTLYSSGEGFAVAFDPWSLAISAIVYVAMDLMSCSKDEARMALQEGAKLCHTIGDYCSRCPRIFGWCPICTQHSKVKCCFNSVLARVVNEQGKLQLGGDFGTPEQPRCDGFTVLQLQQLDFSRMDLTEFYDSIVPTAPDVDVITTANKQKAAGCYYGGGKCGP